MVWEPWGRYRIGKIGFKYKYKDIPLIVKWINKVRTIKKLPKKYM